MQYFLLGLLVAFLIYQFIIKPSAPPEQRAEKLLDTAFDNFRKGNYYNCIQICDESLRYIQHWRAYQLKAVSYYDLNDLHKAFDNAHKSIKLEPDVIKNHLSYMVLDSIGVK